jgi:membrane-associated phospholipid phosphatase
MSTFDERCDSALEPVRRSAFLQRLFSLASTVGDFSIVWHACGLFYALGSRGRLSQALALSVALGCESLIVNQGIKRIFRRSRPTESGDQRFDVRTPSTSSFPSGHASSATFAAVLLTTFSGWPLALAWIVLALVVALSRVVVRIHHASDIVGGVVAGAMLASVAVPLVSRVVG